MRRDRRAACGRFRQARGRRCTGSESSATAEKVPSKTGHFALFRRLQRPGAPRRLRQAPEVQFGLVLGRFPPFWRALSSSRPHTHSTMDIYRLSARSGFWCLTAALLVASQCPLDPRAGTRAPGRPPQDGPHQGPLRWTGFVRVGRPEKNFSWVFSVPARRAGCAVRRRVRQARGWPLSPPM